MKTGIKTTLAAFCAIATNIAAADAIPCDSSAKLPTAGGLDSKYIGLFFDVIGTTPSNILAHADQFARYAPYVDGVAISIKDIPAVAEDGSVVKVSHSQIMNGSQRWTREGLKRYIPVLSKIAKKPHLTESMLIFWMSPTGDNRIGWDDDKGWANYAENMAAVAWLAKESGLKGLMLDPEEYAAQGGNFAQYSLCHRDPPFEVTAKLARQRGREVFSRVFKEYPDAVILSLWCFKKFHYWLQNGRQPYPLNGVDQSGELLHYFLNGMIDAMPPEARVVEGAETYSRSAIDNYYVNAHVLESTTVLPLIAPENVAKYRSQFYLGNTHYFDMYRTNANSKTRWYFGPVDGSRLEHMRLNFEQSLQTATKYVWLYAEANGKLFNWRDGHFANKATWEELAPGMTETIMMAKDPLTLAALRKEALVKDGKLVNLAKDLKGFQLEEKGGLRDYHQKENDRPSVKNVKAGERYAISFLVTEFGAKKGSFRDGAATPFVYWKKNGRLSSLKPVEIKINRDQPRLRGGYLAAECEVVVPEEADELVLDLGAKLYADERVGYQRIAINRLYKLSKPLKNSSVAKWKYDAKAHILTDGNWRLTARVDKKSGTFSVFGENEKTVGSGVLDFTNVKDDTGYPVVRILNLKNLKSLTALYAPDVTSAPGAIADCPHVVDIAVGEIRIPKNIVTPIAKRLAFLRHLGLKTLAPVAVRGVDHRNKFITFEKAPHDLAVKGVQPGELYTAGLSMKRRGPGYVYLNACFRGNGKRIASKACIPQIVMTESRADDVWQSGEVVVRVPDGADELYFDVSAEIYQGYTRFEFKDFKVYKIGEPLPVWPAEALKEKGK